MPGFDWNTNKNFWDKSQKDIAGEFGLPEKYTKFIDDYDPFEENVANRAFSTGVSGLRKEGSRSLFDMLKTSKENLSKSGFAGSGAIGSNVNTARGQLSNNFGTQMEGMRTDRYSSIMGSRKDYEKSIYDMMGQLAQSGVKFENTSARELAEREQRDPMSIGNFLGVYNPETGQFEGGSSQNGVESENTSARELAEEAEREQREPSPGTPEWYKWKQSGKSWNEYISSGG